MSERQLATIRKVAEVQDIPGADLIQAYRVDGWWVVSKKDEYKVGSLCIYLEIDSWVPNSLAPFLSKGKEPRVFNEVPGERLRTIRLKGQVSQGLLLPLNTLDPIMGNNVVNYSSVVEEGDDVTETLGIQLYEPPASTFERCGQARKGGFPYFIPKSDQERIQNLKERTISDFLKKETFFELTEKLEGSSMTVYVNGEDEGVCSRNINLKCPEEGEPTNTFWSVAIRDGLLDKLRDTGLNIAIQGELVGPGIQGNYYSLDKHFFYLYNIWDIDSKTWYPPNLRQVLCSTLGIEHVPILKVDQFSSVNQVLNEANGISKINPEKLREGVVWKAYSTTYSFKAISNEYLLQGKFH